MRRDGESRPFLSVRKADENMKWIDLHLHLDGSLSIDTVKVLAKEQNIPIEDDDELIRRLSVNKDCRDLNEYLEKFDFPLSLLQMGEAIGESVYRLQEELKSQGLDYAEIRFAPQLHCRKGLSQYEVVQYAVDGLNRSDFDAKLILCCMRGSDNHAENIETVKVAERYLGKGVCAIDLAGAEGLFPTSDFADIFALARKKNIPFTIHAGEADGAESVRAAIDFGTSRIGHGIRAIEDINLVREIAKKGIILEMCPTSNLNTCAVDDIKNYPIKKFMDMGVKVTVNTDNITVSDTTLENEFKLIKDTFGLTDKEMEELSRNAENARF